MLGDGATMPAVLTWPTRPEALRRVAATLLLISLGAAGCGDRYGYEPRDGGAPDTATADASALPEAGSTDAGLCGDGVAGADEVCDGADLHGLDCERVGFFEGTLTCRGDCTLDTSGCAERCGNGTLEAGEDCDGGNLAGQTCQGLGLGAGVLACGSDCAWNLTGCPGCGNGVLEAGEACDGTDFGLASCNGALQCTPGCRLDATGCAAPDTGTGADGALYVDSLTVLQAPLMPIFSVLALGSDRATVDASPAGLAPGDEVLLINLQGSATACSTVGRHELLRVASVTSSEVLFQTAVQEVYGVGGNTDLTGQVIVLQRVPNLTSLTVDPGGTLTAPGWNGLRGGVLALRVAGPVTVAAGSTISVSNLGHYGGQGHNGTGTQHGRQGGSICGNPQAVSVSPNDGGGGGGLYVNTSDDCGQGGGGAGYVIPGTWEDFTQTCIGHGASGPAENGGGVYGVNSVPGWYLGSGGGGGATDDHSSTSGSGGRGGGILVLFAQSLEVNGTLLALGGNGQVPVDYSDSGNGGGGSGGTVVLRVGDLSGTGTVAVPGGRGPASQDNNWNSPGGDGSPGRLRIDYQTAYGVISGDPLADWYLEHLCQPAPGYTSVLY